jgi:hypothetical protein
LKGETVAANEFLFVTHQRRVTALNLDRIAHADFFEGEDGLHVKVFFGGEDIARVTLEGDQAELLRKRLTERNVGA